MQRTRIAFRARGCPTEQTKSRVVLFESPDAKGTHRHDFVGTVRALAVELGASSPSELRLSLDSNGDDVETSETVYQSLRYERKTGEAISDRDETGRPVVYYQAQHKRAGIASAPVAMVVPSAGPAPHAKPHEISLQYDRKSGGTTLGRDGTGRPVVHYQAHHKRAVIAPAAAAMVAPSAGPAPHATQPEDSTDVSLTKLPDDVMDQAMMFCSMYHSQLAGGYWTVGKGTATCPHPGGVHTPDDVKKAHWVLGLHRVVQVLACGSAKAPGFLVDRCAGADAWLSGDYKKHCDEHGAANQTAIPLKWTKSKTQFNTEKCANGWREVAERKAANKLEHDAAVAARWSAMQPSQKRQRVDGAKAVEEGDTEFCSCSE